MASVFLQFVWLAQERGEIPHKFLTESETVAIAELEIRIAFIQGIVSALSAIVCTLWICRTRENAGYLREHGPALMPEGSEDSPFAILVVNARPASACRKLLSIDRTPITLCGPIPAHFIRCWWLFLVSLAVAAEVEYPIHVGGSDPASMRRSPMYILARIYFVSFLGSGILFQICDVSRMQSRWAELIATHTRRGILGDHSEDEDDHCGFDEFPVGGP